MRFSGKVAEFNRSTGQGLITTKAPGGKIKLLASNVRGGAKVDVGDYVEFEMGFSLGASQALDVTVTSRMAAGVRAASKAQLGKPIGEEKSHFAQKVAELPPLPAPKPPTPAPIQPPVVAGPPLTDKDECGHCHKLMVPRLVTFKGKPERSFCPFCGGVHVDFRSRVSPTAAAGLAAFVIGSILS